MLEKQTARDEARDAKHAAEIANNTIASHVMACEKAHEDNGKRLDKLDGSIARVHARIDKLLWTLLVGLAGLVAQFAWTQLTSGMGGG